MNSTGLVSLFVFRDQVAKELREHIISVKLFESFISLKR